MKQIQKRAMAVCLVLALLMTPSVQASDALGSQRYQRTVELAAGTTLGRSSLWSATYSDLRTEHYLTYSPNEQVTPMVYAGTYVTDMATLTEAAAVLEGQGYRVVGAVNGGFFNSNRTAVGMLLAEGEILALDRDNHLMVGFGMDGTVFVDDREPIRRVSWQGMQATETADGAGLNWAYGTVSLELAAFNTTRKNGELCLFSDAFGTTTHNTVNGVDVILRPLSGRGLRMNDQSRFEVVSVTDSRQEGVDLDNQIPKDSYVLSVNQNSPAALLETVAALTPGMQVSVSVEGVSPQWEQAQYGLSALHQLVRNGQVVSGLEEGSAPRTAIGLKEDGSVVFYTLDGRQSGYSVGGSYTQVARRLVELGCVTGVALDGGGSTVLGATMPGEQQFTIQNHPSGGGRRVHNCILLVSRTAPTGQLEHIYVDSVYDVALTGSTIPLTATGADQSGYAAPWLGPVQWSASDGFFWERLPGEMVYTAPDSAGTYLLNAANGQIQGSKPLRVVNGLSGLKVERRDSGKRVDSLMVQAGEVVALDAVGVWYHLPVAMGTLDVSWSAEGNIGTVDDYGMFWAGAGSAVGRITATAGGKQVTIPVTVMGELPFSDVEEGDWFYDAVVYAYQNGLMNGMTDTSFAPDGVLTRAQMVTMLYRLEGQPSMTGVNPGTPFADADPTAWYGIPVYWAKANGLVNGVSETHFDPDGAITRQQLAVLLYRYAAYREMDVTLWGPLDCYVDQNAVADYARTAMEWAVGSGVMTGIDPFTLSPEGRANRAQAATMFQRLFV